MIKFHREKERRYEETVRTMTVFKKILFVEMIKKFSAQKEMIYVQNVGDRGFDSGTVYKPMHLYLFRMEILTILIMYFILILKLY